MCHFGAVASRNGASAAAKKRSARCLLMPDAKRDLMAKRRVARSRNTSRATKRRGAVIPVTTHLPHSVGVLMHANIVPGTCPHYRIVLIKESIPSRSGGFRAGGVPEHERDAYE